MKRKVYLWGWVVVCFIFLSVSKAQAMIIINEFLADPPSGLSGDANQDGVTSSTQDEFIELYNPGSFTVDLTGWSLADELKTRHVFAGISLIEPLSFFVVFGADASTGSLGLNNGGDVITLFNDEGDVIDHVLYGSEGGKDQSLTRLSSGEFALHSMVDSQKRIFSPGQPYAKTGNTVDEKETAMYLSLGLLLVGFMKLPRRLRVLS